MPQIQSFIDFMTKHDCAPANSSDIKADGKWADYQIAGDKNGKKKGFYTLKIDGDFASGACGDRRTGEVYQWRGKPSRALTDEERREYAKRRAAEKKAEDEEERKRHAQTAQKARERWGRAKMAKHAYLTRKGITGEGTRVLDGLLLVPMYADDAIQGVQSIDADGVKMFQAGGRKKGCFCPLTTAKEPKDIIGIAEGLATAASCRAATGWPMLVAFDAGNLKPVAEAIRKKYPSAQIVILGDNDTSGTGQKKATEAAQAVCGIAIVSEIADKDFNDLAQERGIEYIKDYIFELYESAVNAAARGRVDGYFCVDVVSCEASPAPLSSEDWEYRLNQDIPLEAYSEEARAEIALYNPQPKNKVNNAWKNELVCNEKGGIKPKLLGNCQLILENDNPWYDMFCFDEFAQEKMIIKCPSWENESTFKPRPICDDDVTWIRIGLEKRYGITSGGADVKKALDAVIKKNRKNPAQEYMRSLKWDGVKRLDKWLSYYAGAETEPFEYLKAVGTKWMVAAVTRIMRPGVKFDHMLILEGEQGVGKSTLFRELATIHGKEYFDDTIRASDLGTKDVIPKLQGVMIIEIAELAGLRKSDMDTFKQQITIQEDRIVNKYANEPTRYPRQFVMAGTVNVIQGYLDDPTGNRRFWPVKAGKISIEALRKDKEQLWAEAMELYRAGETLYLDDGLVEKLQELQKSRKVIHPWHQYLEELANGRDYVYSDEIWEHLRIDMSHRDKKNNDVVAKIMVELGYESQRKQKNGIRGYGWKRKVKVEEIEL